MKKVIFTICSNNYLAKAKTLGDSILAYNPDYEFFIFLCDSKLSDVDYGRFMNFSLNEISVLNIEKFKDMSERYNIIELNTSIKPFCFNYLLNVLNFDFVFYLDPDICLFDNLSYIEEKLEDNDIILTPHICTPIPFDGLRANENDFAQYGLYNLGFLAVKKSHAAQELVDWWMERLEVNCYIRPQEGIFVDQLPINLAPIFFDNVYITKHLGLNAAPWNLHERNIYNTNGTWTVNNEFPLIFFHFSNFNINFSQGNLSTAYQRVNLKRNDELYALYEWYRNKLLENDHTYFSQLAYHYNTPNTQAKPSPKTPAKSKSRFKSFIKRILSVFHKKKSSQ